MWIKVLLATVILALVNSASAGDTLNRDDFPPDFIFGAGTSAYQVEGAADEDGRTPSILDVLALDENKTRGYGDRTCDQYHNYKEDVRLMANMGLNAYRFSISWSRLIPNGKGAVNPKGLEYYNNLINELISHDIQPHVTLHHSDLPQALEDEYGGWVSRRVVKDFEAYANVCFNEFGDRVKHWTTMNEANIFVLCGYDLGMLPPQRCSSSIIGIANCSKGNSSTEPYLAAHNMLLAHASATALYRRKYQELQRGFIGINIFTMDFSPLTNTTEDLSATQRAQDFNLGWFLNPIMFGEYPETLKRSAGWKLPSFTKAESNMVKGSIDFLGINFYYTCHVKNYPSSLPMGDRDILADLAFIYSCFGNATFAVEIPVRPWGLKNLLELLRNSYGNFPIYIHENGQQTLRDSSLDDWSRVIFMHEYIKSVLDSLRNGVNVRGYFVWSLLDLLEIITGYQTSYGLYYIDLNDPNLKRQPKLSAKWYSDFLHNRSMNPKITTELEKSAPMLSAAA
ncbi:beta-glucosidase 11 isoform X1 [Neltuma alba]|uniref:beta-glucosidase 11 isoform X1 n=1 Tax=Neltuma alba TaxID=207710 RepID=UPI0010A59ADE|nr:beta-glucosidase 11-like isoform X1 [Prosopis alba]